MVLFNELRMTSGKHKLIIDCEISGLTEYSGMYIKTVYLDYYKNFHGTPSSKALLVYENTNDDTSIRAIRKTVPSTDLSYDTMGVNKFDGGLFYVIVDCAGDYPEGYEPDPHENRDIGVAPDWHKVYARGMQFVSKMVAEGRACCAPPAEFEEFALLWYGLRLAVAVCDTEQASKIWDNFLRSIAMHVAASPCGCN